MTDRACSVKQLYILLLLLVTFAFNFSHRDGWKDAQGPGDEPAYIESAYTYWRSGVVPDKITWSPGYVLLMSPFVGAFGKETGYKIWRFTLFAGISFLAYVAFSRMFGSAWLGAVLALCAQMFVTPYLAPTLQSLVCLLYLICFCSLTDNTRFLGLTFGILLNGIFVSSTMGFVFFSFGALCLIFFPRLIFSRRFFVQFVASVALFGAMLHNFDYDIRKYPEKAYERGSAGLYHQLSLLIVSSGRSASYLEPGEADPRPGTVDEYHRHLKAVDRYYLDKFGEKEADLRSRRHDERWPEFLLDWPWMMTKDPELMKEYRHQVYATLKDSALHAFQITLPFGEYNINTTSLKRGVFVIPLMLVLMLPPLVRLVLEKPLAPLELTWPSRLQILFFLSCLTSLLPLMLVKPLLIYFPPLIPAYLMGIALLNMLFRLGLQKID